jgi:hypothetical protein
MPWANYGQSGWKLIQKIGTGLSVILSLAGFCAIVYRGLVIGGFGYNPPAPCRDLGLLLLVSGIILFILTFISGQKFSKKEKIETHLR